MVMCLWGSRIRKKVGNEKEKEEEEEELDFVAGCLSFFFFFLSLLLSLCFASDFVFFLFWCFDEDWEKLSLKERNFVANLHRMESCTFGGRNASQPQKCLKLVLLGHGGSGKHTITTNTPKKIPLSLSSPSPSSSIFQKFYFSSYSIQLSFSSLFVTR